MRGVTNGKRKKKEKKNSPKGKGNIQPIYILKANINVYENDLEIATQKHKFWNFKKI